MLGDEKNATELRELLERIEETRFEVLLETWRSCGGRVAGLDASPGRTEGGVDWVWFEPYEKRYLSLEEARVRLRAPSLTIPVAHPRGWDFSALVGSYAMPPGGHIVRLGVTSSAGWDGDVPLTDDDGYASDGVD